MGKKRWEKAQEGRKKRENIVSTVSTKKGREEKSKVYRTHIQREGEERIDNHSNTSK
jgi:hypothetical protein